jgi:hypothetical protein
MHKTTQSTAIYENSPEYGFGWWFSYFWKEVSVRNRDEEMLKSVLARVFADKFPPDVADKSYNVKRDLGNAVAAQFTEPLPEPKDLNSHPAYYRQLLTDLLNIGFKEMPTAPKSFQERKDALQAMFVDYIEAQKQGGRVPLALAYRGDTRDFATVIKQEGALNRIDLNRDRTKNLNLLNMHKAWHPFFDQAVGSKTYARGASGDNCLYSVLSVASDVSIPVGFPLIEDKNMYTLKPLPLPAVPRDLSRFDYGLYRDCLPVPDKFHRPVHLARCAVSGVGNKQFGIFLATETYIYVVKVRKAVFTQDFVER